jgi:hypothetical protein
MGRHRVCQGLQKQLRSLRCHHFHSALPASAQLTLRRPHGRQRCVRANCPQRTLFTHTPPRCRPHLPKALSKKQSRTATPIGASEHRTRACLALRKEGRQFTSAMQLRRRSPHLRHGQGIAPQQGSFMRHKRRIRTCRPPGTLHKSIRWLHKSIRCWSMGPNPLQHSFTLHRSIRCKRSICSTQRKSMQRNCIHSRRALRGTS